MAYQKIGKNWQKSFKNNDLSVALEGANRGEDGQYCTFIQCLRAFSGCLALADAIQLQIEE
uniref:hypothetical protein n=1 Tax=Cupriavidus taiwanensis TaxID=164546 RepID=UPI001F119701|nr:hypothetical protein [Cupriavidus taiwanensis]